MDDDPRALSGRALEETIALHGRAMAQPQPVLDAAVMHVDVPSPSAARVRDVHRTLSMWSVTLWREALRKTLHHGGHGGHGGPIGSGQEGVNLRVRRVPCGG